jgi:hypothetical protein
MKPFLRGIVTLLAIVVATAMLRAEAPPLPSEPAVGLSQVFGRHMDNLAELIKSQPLHVVRPYLDDMFSIAADMGDTMEALDPLCRAYPQTDNKWRKESFLPYLIHCRVKIRDKIELLGTTASSNLPDEVRGEARRLQEDIQKMAEWIEALIVAVNSTLEPTSKTKQP